MKRLMFAAPLVLLASLEVEGCSSDSSTQPAAADDGGASDTGVGDTGSTDTGGGDTGSGDEVSTDGGDSGSCVTLPAPTKTVDASKPLMIFDAGGLDLRLDLSADGKLALIEDATTGDLFLFDTTKGTLTKVGSIDGELSSVGANALSADGRRIGALHGKTDIVAGSWDICTGAWLDAKNTNPKGCDGPPNNQGGVFGLNRDGLIAVGLEWNLCTAQAVMWKASGAGWTATALAHLGKTNGNSRATAVSDDGTLIGGFAERDAADRSPALWKADGTGTLLEPTGEVVGEVLAISHDGKMAVGIWNGLTSAGAAENTGFTWTEKDGITKVGTLPSPLSQDFVWLNAISADNKLVFGAAGDPSWYVDLDGSEEFAIVWSKAKGMRKLQDIVAAAKITIPDGMHLTSVMAASEDGTVLLGTATDSKDPMLAQHTFVLRMPVSAYDL